MSGLWIYVIVAALHLPGIAILYLLLRDLADSDPPESADPGTGGGGPPHGWRWRRRPSPEGGRRRARRRARTPSDPGSASRAARPG